MIQFDEHMFQRGRNHQPEMVEKFDLNMFFGERCCMIFSEDLLALISIMNEKVRQHPKAPDSVGKCCKLSLLRSVVI